MDKKKYLELTEIYKASVLQQLYKKVTGENHSIEDKKVFPVSVVQAIFDGVSGLRLDDLLANNNCIYLKFAGNFAKTVLQVDKKARRTGLIITFKDAQNITHTKRFNDKFTITDVSWSNINNWVDLLTNLEDDDVIEHIKERCFEYVLDNISYISPDDIVDNVTSSARNLPLSANQGKYLNDKLNALVAIEFKIVETLPEHGESRYIYLVPQSVTETGNVYTEYVWITAKQAFESIGGFNIQVDDELNISSVNPVQNQVVYKRFDKLENIIIELKNRIKSLETLVETAWPDGAVDGDQEHSSIPDKVIVDTFK